MKSISFAKFLTLGCFALLLPVACGDDDDAPPPPSGMAGAGGEGEGGAPGLQIPGTSSTPTTIECGSSDCKSVSTLLGVFINPCCTAADSCGLDSGFLTLIGTDLKGACLPQNKEDTATDAACPSSPESSVMVGSQTIGVEGFKGCCRPNNTCGFMVDKITTEVGVATSPGLGCVDPAAFGAPGNIPCGEGAGGAGAGGAGAGGEGVGGAPLGGAGGMSSEGGAPIAGGGGAGGAP